MGLEPDSPVHNVWKPDLYRIQLDAPKPLPMYCPSVVLDRPDFLGCDYHGHITHKEADKMLQDKPDGAYLVRNSEIAKGQFHTLSLKFNGRIHHFKLYYDPSSGFYVREKRYDSIKTLVADGLVAMYIELRAADTIQRLSIANYHESPYMTLNKRKLRAISKEQNMKVIDDPFILQMSPTSKNHSFPERYEKKHLFKLTTFKGLNWCELCGNFLWGFTAQGVKCEDCGFVAHGRCSENLPNDCIPDLKYIRGVFGIDLTTLLTAHSTKLPFVVVKCAEEVEARGLTTEGIYRLSGFADEVETLKLALDKDGEKTDLSESAYSNINVITGTFKLYLRLLPVPLITFAAHPELVKAIECKSIQEKISAIKLGLILLPHAHYNTLQYIIKHLNKVSLYQAINKMTAHNLATVFAPTLIDPSTNLSLGPPDLTADIYLLETIIIYYDRIFD